MQFLGHRITIERAPKPRERDLTPVGGRVEQWRQLRCALGFHYWGRRFTYAGGDRQGQMCSRWGNSGGCWTDLVWRRVEPDEWRIVWPHGWRAWVSPRIWHHFVTTPRYRRTIWAGFKRIGPARRWAGRQSL